MRFIYTKAFIIFSICVGVVVAVTFLEVKGYGAPIQAVFLNAPRPITYAVESVVKPVRFFFSTIYSLKNIAQQNSQLTNQVYTLQQQLVGYDQSLRENSALKKELGFITVAKGKFVPCSVLEQNPLDLTGTLIINCGQDVGITKGQGVLSQGYLIGKVIFAGKNSSTILLITSSQFSTDASISKTGASGLAAGSFGSGIILDQLSQTDVVEKGDLVVTAGINDKIPKNILIGEVGSVLSKQNDSFKKMTVLSPIDFSNLQYVFVAQ
jgi:rod shape-determining protein MreC